MEVTRQSDVESAGHDLNFPLPESVSRQGGPAWFDRGRPHCRNSSGRVFLTEKPDHSSDDAEATASEYGPVQIGDRVLVGPKES